MKMKEKEAKSRLKRKMEMRVRTEEEALKLMKRRHTDRSTLKRTPTTMILEER